MTEAADDHILKEISATGVMTLTLNRAAKKNALTQAMYHRLADALTQADEGETVGAVVIQGAGGVFTAGNDLKDFLAGAQASDAAGESGAAALLRRLAQIHVPVVVAIDGPAIGVGVTMLLHVDFVVAGPTALLATPFVDLGACPEGGSSFLLAERIGRDAANRLLLLCEAFEAPEAAEVGLVDRLVEDAGAEARAIAERLAAKPRGALREAKRLLQEARQPKLEQVFAREFEAFGRRLRSPETQEIVMGKLAKH